MIIGVPRERKNLEKRVAITPDGAKELVSSGHTVLVETNAGVGSFFEDDAYRAAGCQVATTLKDIWAADMVVKVKEPHEEEYEFFRPGLILFDYLHLASLEKLTKKLCESQVTALGYELVRTDDGRLPLLEPMSEVAGKLSIICGSYFLLSQNGGRGILLGGVSGQSPAKVVILGLGTAGMAALTTAYGMGAKITAIDTKPEKVKGLKDIFDSHVTGIISSRESLVTELADADLVIGSVLIPGAKAPKIISRSMVKAMKKGSVFVDISIDQGGCSETSRVTSLSQPTYVDEGVIHYCVPNMPAQSPTTSTVALSAATLPYILTLANHGFAKAVAESGPLRASVNTHQGMVRNRAIADTFGLAYNSI